MDRVREEEYERSWNGRKWNHLFDFDLLEYGDGFLEHLFSNFGPNVTLLSFRNKLITVEISIWLSSVSIPKIMS